MALTQLDNHAFLMDFQEYLGKSFTLVITFS
ncbi:hypothetical protein ACNKHS_05400 [Shigella flexneri]